MLGMHSCSARDACMQFKGCRVAILGMNACLQCWGCTIAMLGVHSCNAEDAAPIQQSAWSSHWGLQVPSVFGDDLKQEAHLSIGS